MRTIIGGDNAQILGDSIDAGSNLLWGLYDESVSLIGGQFMIGRSGEAKVLERPRVAMFLAVAVAAVVLVIREIEFSPQRARRI